jgi:hypothetical protein
MGQATRGIAPAPGAWAAQGPLPAVRHLTLRRLPGPLRRAAGSAGSENVAYYGLGWDGAEGTSGGVPVTAFVNPESQRWSTTPCLTLLGHPLCSGVAFGAGFQNLTEGVTGAAVIASGIADQGVENWIWAPYTAPPAGSSSGGGTWTTDVTLTAHVDTFLLANNVGALSDVGTDILNENADLPYLGQDSRSLGVGTYVDIDTSFLSDAEASQVSQDILNRNLPALLTVVQSALQSEVDSALGTLETPPTTGSQAAAAALNALMGAMVGGNQYQSTFTQTFTLPAGQGVLVGFGPELMVANAGAGITGAMAISLVQVKIAGTTHLQGTPTTLQVTPMHSNGVRYNYGSTSWVLPIYLKTTAGKPLPGQTLSITFPGSNGNRQRWTCVTDHSGYCQEDVGPLAIEPGPQVPLTVSFAGTSQYLSAARTVNITENPGPTTLQLSAASPSETGTGFPAGSTVVLQASLSPALAGAHWGGLAPLGAVEFLANGNVVGQCRLQATASGAACATVWNPNLAGAPEEPVRLQAAWAGNLDWHGASSTPWDTAVYVPGLYLTASAHGARLGQIVQCTPGSAASCHTLTYGDRTVLRAWLYENGAPARAGYTVHFALGTSVIGSCQTEMGNSCQLPYTVSPPPTATTSYSVQAWVTGPAAATHPGVAATATFTYYTPAWPLRVVPLGPAWTLPMSPVGLGAAGPGRLWVFLAPRAVAAPESLDLVDTTRRTILARFPLPGAVQAFGCAADGSAWVVTAGGPGATPAPETLLGRSPVGPGWRVPLPPGFSVQALAPVSAQQVWLVGTLRPRGVSTAGALQAPPLLALRLQLPTGAVTATAVLPGSAGMEAAPHTAVADAAGLWVATNPDATVYWVSAAGATAFHPRGVAPRGAAPGPGLDTAGIDSVGQGWMVGYGSSGGVAAWPIVADGRLGVQPLSFGPQVNMVSTGVAVNDIGVAYISFSAIGGPSGLPGIAGLSADEHTALTLLPLGSLAGGGAGQEVLTSSGHLWAAVPFSHALFELEGEASP